MAVDFLIAVISGSLSLFFAIIAFKFYRYDSRELQKNWIGREHDNKE